MSKSKARFLAELLSSDGKVIKAKSEASTIIVGDLPTIPNSKLQNSSVTIAGEGLSLGASLTLDTADVTEHTDYKYYTNARADARIVNAGSANWNTAYTVANAALPKAGGTLTGSIDVTGSVTADGLTVDVASGGATATAATFNNGGSGANTKARLDFLAASTRYAGISGGYGASSPEMSFDISGTDVLAINATGIDVTGTATMDGLTVNSGATNTVANFSSTDIGAYLNIADQYQTGRLNATGAVFAIEADPSNLYASSKVRLSTDGVKRLDVDSNGDISFYEDTGTTPKMVWDASAESLGINSSAPSTKLEVLSADGLSATNIARFASNNNAVSIGIGYNEIRQVADGHNLNFGVHSGTAMTIQDGGNVNIGSSLMVGSTTAPTSALHTSGNVAAGKFESTGSTYVDIDNGTVTGRLQTISSVFNIGTATAGTSLALKSGNGVEAMRIDSLGRVGIGTSSIDNKVNIQESALSGRGASNGNTSLTLEHATDTGIQFFSATQTQLRFGDAASTAAGAIIYEHDTDKLRLNTGSLLTVATAGAERMRISSDGSVGIGGASGGAILQLNNSSSSYLDIKSDNVLRTRIYNDSSQTILESTTSNLIFKSDSTERMRVTTSSGGNTAVGIGTSSPSYPLEVAGNVKFTNASFGAFISPYGDDTYINMLGSGRIQFRTNGSERMRIDSSGNVGINQTNPSAFNTLGGTQVVIGDGASQSENLTLYSNTYGHVAFADSNTSGSTAQYAGLIQYYHVDNTMRLYTNAAERMRIDSLGNVGIGTTATNILHGTNYGTTKLHIDGGTDRGQVIIQGDSVAQIVMSDNGATANSRVFITQVNDGVMNLKSVNDNGTSKATIMSMTSAGATTFSGSVTSTGLTVNATGDAALLLQSSASSQTLRLDQNSIRTTTNTPINFLTNSTPALTLSTSQNVNIPNGKIKVSATTAPVAGVDIAGNSDTVPALKIGSGDTYGHFFYDSGATGDLVIKRGAGGAQSESMRLARATGAATFSGSVTSSGTFLKTGTNGNYTIAANGNDFYYGRNGANYHIANTANGAFQFLTGSSSATGLSISSSQNVNIPNGGLMVGATTAPDSKLTVNITAAGDGIELQSNETSIAKLSRTTVGSTVVASLDGVSGRPIHVGGVVNEDVILANAGGNVGIGCVPTSPLHIKSATNVNVRFDDSGSSSYTWYMNDAQNLYIPNVQLASTHTFYAMGQRKVDIDASGNLLVGTTNNNAGGANVVGHSFGALGYISSTRDSNWVAQLNRKTNDGDIVLLKKDGSTVGSIGVMHTNNMYFTGLSGHGGLQFGTANVTPLIAGSESNGGVDLGASNLQFQNLYLSGISYVGGLYNTGIYNQQSGDIQFWVTNVGEAVRIQQNTGNLLVGTTDTDPSNNGAGGDAGHAFSSTGYISSARSEGTVALFNRMDSDGDIAAFRKDGAVVGTIGTNGGDLYFSDASYGGIKPLGDGYAVVPSTNSGADYDNAMSLGYPSIRWKDLYLSNSTIVASRTTYGAGGFWDNAANGNNTGVRTGGNQVFLTDGNGGVTDNARDLGATNRRLRDVFVGGGVYLGGTGAANKLDDYEEGTWTPIIKDGTTSGATLGISVTRAHYTKVGRMCTITAYIGRADATALTQNMIITNLPFTQDGGPQTGGVIWVDNFAADQLGMCYANDGTVLYFRSFSNTNAYILTNQFENGRALYFSRTYETT